MCVPGHEVTMFLWVECVETQHTLLEPSTRTYTVQPPVHAHDDRVALEMHLDNLAKLKFLVELRKDPNPTPKMREALAANRFIIRGMMQSWKSPANHTGQRMEISYPQDRLRAA